jgi:succinylglutamic semialdehyde dehydrogenase
MSEGSNFIRGTFVRPENAEGELVINSPADRKDLVGRHAWHRGLVDEAVGAARSAFAAWRRTSPEARAMLLRGYQAALKQNAEALALMIAREIGKPLWEAKTEVQAMISKVEVTLGEGAAFTSNHRIADLPGEIRHRPHGVIAVIGPFNFPGHLPNGQIVPALLAGNTVVFKPSDKGAGTARVMAQCLSEAGFPPGVFNVVQGAAEVAEKLTTHEGIDAILFTGSAPVGQKIVAANAHRPGVLIALELGGKNASLVLDDADLERTVREVAFSGFATAGQRCTASSRVLVTKGIAAQFCERLAQVARGVKVGYVLDDGVFMGPVISEATRQHLLTAQALALRSGFEAVAPGGVVDVPGREGFYVRPAVHVAGPAVTKVNGYTDTELFAPDLAVQVVDSTEAAIALANDSPFGLSAAVFTSSAASFEVCADQLRVGVLHWNRSSAGASGRLPFGGMKGSGNHRPAGILMGTSCLFPQAVLLPAQTTSALPTWPGLSFEEEASALRGT